MRLRACRIRARGSRRGNQLSNFSGLNPLSSISLVVVAVQHEVQMRGDRTISAPSII
jgi:hypothetical protein